MAEFLLRVLCTHKHVRRVETTDPDSFKAFNFSLSCTDVMDLTQAEMEGREQAMNALIALKNVVPGFQKAKLRNFGMTIGTRDSRKIVGR